MAPRVERDNGAVTNQPVSAPIPEQVHDILTDKPTGFVATVRPDGMLSVTPVALMFDGNVVRFSTTKDRKKYRNLLRDDRVTMAVAHRNNPNRYVEVRGHALLEDDDDHAFIDSIAHHYMGADRYTFDRPGQVRVTVTIVADYVSTPEIPLADNPPQARDK
jgi:PPOX class probable F420-dependent enzyme